MNDFLNVAKSLEIKEISKDVNCDVDDSSQDQFYEENIEPKNGNAQEEDTVVTPCHDESVVTNSFPINRVFLDTLELHIKG